MVNREINEHGQTPPERRDDTVDDPIIPAPNAIESMKRKHEERLEKQKKKKRVVFGSSEDRATLHQIHCFSTWVG